MEKFDITKNNNQNNKSPLILQQENIESVNNIGTNLGTNLNNKNFTSVRI